ncbi:hypothetical protein VKT23_001193 [Stygiomarasmius scandens]|uniref:Transmembrane protein n=1 Tax=Marasmiellus scandens TaxID=2682957 RepID=A0ABR1K6R1_9AGAR
MFSRPDLGLLWKDLGPQRATVIALQAINSFFLVCTLASIMSALILYPATRPLPDVEALPSVPEHLHMHSTSVSVSIQKASHSHSDPSSSMTDADDLYSPIPCRIRDRVQSTSSSLSSLSFSPTTPFPPSLPTLPLSLPLSKQCSVRRMRSFSYSEPPSPSIIDEDDAFTIKQSYHRHRSSSYSESTGLSSPSSLPFAPLSPSLRDGASFVDISLEEDDTKPVGRPRRAPTPIAAVTFAALSRSKSKSRSMSMSTPTPTNASQSQCHSSRRSRMPTPVPVNIALPRTCSLNVNPRSRLNTKPNAKRPISISASITNRLRSTKSLFGSGSGFGLNKLADRCRSGRAKSINLREMNLETFSSNFTPTPRSGTESCSSSFKDSESVSVSDEGTVLASSMQVDEYREQCQLFEDRSEGTPNKSLSDISKPSSQSRLGDRCSRVADGDSKNRGKLADVVGSGPVEDAEGEEKATSPALAPKSLKSPSSLESLSFRYLNPRPAPRPPSSLPGDQQGQQSQRQGLYLTESDTRAATEPEPASTARLRPRQNQSQNQSQKPTRGETTSMVSLEQSHRPQSPFSNLHLLSRKRAANSNTTSNSKPLSMYSSLSSIHSSLNKNKNEEEWSPSSYGTNDPDPFAPPEPGAAVAVAVAGSQSGLGLGLGLGLGSSTLSIASTIGTGPGGLGMIEEMDADADVDMGDSGLGGTGYDSDSSRIPGGGVAMRMSAWGRLQLPVPSSASVGLLRDEERQVSRIRRGGHGHSQRRAQGQPLKPRQRQKEKQREECPSWVEVSGLGEERRRGNGNGQVVEEQDEQVVQEALLAQRLLRKLNREGGGSLKGKGKGKGKSTMLQKGTTAGSGSGSNSPLPSTTSTQGISWGAARSFLLMNSLAKERERERLYDLAKVSSTQRQTQTQTHMVHRKPAPVVGERF